MDDFQNHKMAKYLASNLWQPTNLRKAIYQEDITQGAFMIYTEIQVAQHIATLGFDWCAIDIEHSPVDALRLTQLIQAIQWHSHGTCVPVVRLNQWETHEWIQYSLDAGAGGLICPQVNTKKDAESIVAKVKYPPQGQRGKAPFRLLQGITDQPGPRGQSVIEWANEATAIIVQIESAEAVENVEEICSVPGVDVIWVGTLDMRVSMGLAPAGDGDEPEFVAAMEKICAAAEKYGKPLGGLVFPPEEAILKRLNQGFRFCCTSCDCFSMVMGMKGMKGGFDMVARKQSDQHISKTCNGA
jgi:2-keto-3-deoxy-L-rhamnonate aldolase RhmA